MQRNTMRDEKNKSRINFELQRIEEAAQSKISHKKAFKMKNINKRTFHDVSEDKSNHTLSPTKIQPDSEDELVEQFECNSTEIHGQYSIPSENNENFTIYLQAAWHIDLITPGQPCEVFVDDSWQEAKVESLVKGQKFINNKFHEKLKVSISYVINGDKDNEVLQAMTVTKSLNDIRFKVPDFAKIESFSESIPTKLSVQQSENVTDEWVTVNTTTIEPNHQVNSFVVQEIESNIEKNHKEDDYRGFKIDSEAYKPFDISNTVLSMQFNENVKFKKRKRNKLKK